MAKSAYMKVIVQFNTVTVRFLDVESSFLIEVTKMVF